MMRTLKGIARHVAGPRMLGMADYYRFPSYKNVWGGPFNGQVARRKLFDQIFEKVRPAAIIETGTYRGDSTEYFATFSVPVHSIEAVPRNFGFAQARFMRRKNVRVVQGDSRVGLRSILRQDRLGLGNQSVFAYLDAHWFEDLPLAEEIDIIFSSLPSAVVMVDDFCVPDDDGYGYDDYGQQKSLTAQYLRPMMLKHDLCLFYPSTRSSQETGARRGCAVLCGSSRRSDLDQLDLLRRASVDEDE